MKDTALPTKVRTKEAKKSKPQSNEWLWLRDVSFGGWALMGLNLLTVASAYKSLRIPVGGLLLHLYMIPLFLLFLLYAIKRFDLFPKKILYPIGMFLLLFFASMITSDNSNSNFALNEIFKIGASVLTLLTCALMVKTKSDFRIAIISACIAATLLSFQNIIAPGTTFGSEAAAEHVGEIANRNAFSLYVLPAFLFGMYLVLDRTSPKILKLPLIFGLLMIVIAIFASGNRSGWLGVLVVGVTILGRGRSIKALLLIIVLALGTYYAFTKYIGTETIERRASQTTFENESDETRFDILPVSLDIAYENPLLGISPQEVSYELGRRMTDRAVEMDDAFVLDPHNVFAYIVVGSGFPALFALILVGWMIWKRPLEWKDVLRHIPDAKDSHTILRTLIILWIVRGMFTREILYSPSFNIGLGLCIGFCISQGLWIPKAIQLYRLKLSFQQMHHKNNRSDS